MLIYHLGDLDQGACLASCLVKYYKWNRWAVVWKCSTAQKWQRLKASQRQCSKPGDEDDDGDGDEDDIFWAIVVVVVVIVVVVVVVPLPSKIYSVPHKK